MVRLRLAQTHLDDLLIRYLGEISPAKKSHSVERAIIHAFLRQPIAKKSLDVLSPADFASYRDQRLLSVKLVSVQRELGIIRHCLEVAGTEWNIPLDDSPLDKI